MRQAIKSSRQYLDCCPSLLVLKLVEPALRHEALDRLGCVGGLSVRHLNMESLKAMLHCPELLVGLVQSWVTLVFEEELAYDVNKGTTSKASGI